MISRNIKLLKVQKFFNGVWPLAVLVVVYVETITHSYATAMGIFSIASLVRLIAEIPTGIISDKIGRKKTLMLSSFMGLSTALLLALAGTFDSMYLLFICSFTFGFGHALNSGTDEALMYETMEDLERVDEFHKLFSKSEGLKHFGLFISGLVATVITFVFNSSPYSLLVLAWISVLPVLIELVLFSFCVEPKARINKTDANSSFKHLGEAFKSMVKNKPLRLFVMFRVFSRTSYSGMARIGPAYYAQLVPLYLVSIVSMIKEFVHGSSYFIALRFKKFGLEKRLFISNYLITGVKLIAIAINNFLTPFITIISNFAMGTSETSIVSIMHNNFSKKERATMGSIVSTLTALGNAVMFYVSGVIADIYSFRIAVLILVLMRLFAVMYANFKFRKLGL